MPSFRLRPQNAQSGNRTPDIQLWRGQPWTERSWPGTQLAAPALPVSAECCDPDLVMLPSSALPSPSRAVRPWLPCVVRLLPLSEACYLFFYFLLATNLINSLIPNKKHCYYRSLFLSTQNTHWCKMWYPTSLMRQNLSMWPSLAWNLLVQVELVVPVQGNLPALFL